MPQAARTFRIFVSSTFEDLKEERNALQRRVFPRLREFCAGRGARFQAIDLRWGVSEEAGADQQTMNVCLSEIARCRAVTPRPNFIALLGDRYGWCPPPAEIRADEYARIQARVTDPEHARLLKQWYVRDDNVARPDAGGTPQAAYCLKPREGSYEDWIEVEAKLRAVLLDAIDGLSLAPDAARKYTASATEQEIADGALDTGKVPDANEHVFCFFRRIDGLPVDRSAEGFRDLDDSGASDGDAAARLAELKRTLSTQLPGNVHDDYRSEWTGSGLNGCAVSSVGDLIVSAGRDRTVRVWNAGSGAELAVLRGHEGAVNDCAVSADATLIASASDDGTVKLWNVGAPGELWEAEEAGARETLHHGEPVRACAVSGNGALVASASASGVKVCDGATGVLLVNLEELPGTTDCDLAADGSVLTSAHVDGKVRTWDAATGAELRSLNGLETPVSACAVSADGSAVAAVASSGAGRAWATVTGVERCTLSGHDGAVTDCAITPDGRRIVSAGEDGTVRVWDGHSGAELAVIEAGGGAVTACAIFPDALQVVSGAADNSLSTWDVAARTRRGVLGGHTSATTDHIPKLCEDVWRELAGVIDAQLGQLEQEEGVTGDIRAHQAFARERLVHFVGRKGILGEIERYITGSGRIVLAILGDPGSGKSALLARAAEQARVEHEHAYVVSRFIGATPESSDIRALLSDICQQLSDEYGAGERPPGDYRELVAYFSVLLGLACAERPLILFIDALDQLSSAESARGLGWLPALLPTHVRVILSTLPGECEAALRAKHPAPAIKRLGRLSPTEAKTILERWLASVERTLTVRQRNEVLGKFEDSPTPLYLKLCFEEARWWRSYDPVAPHLHRDVDALIRRNLFARLADPSNHGSTLVKHGLGCLAASRHGLSEDELVDVLSDDTEVKADFFERSPRSPRVERLPIVIWSRLYFDLRPYLAERSSEGATLLVFFHGQLSEAADREYLRGTARTERHRALARYFRGKADPGGQGTWDGGDVRGLSELPYHLTLAGDELRDELQSTLTDFGFLERKAADVGVARTADGGRAHGGIYRIEEDLRRALLGPSPFPNERLSILLEALSNSSHLLEKEPSALAPQVQNLLYNDHGESGPAGALVARARDTLRNRTWLRLRSRSTRQIHSALTRVLTHGDAICALEGSANRLASASADGTVRVWDAGTGTLEATHRLPASRLSALGMAADGSCIVVGTDRGIAILRNPTAVASEPTFVCEGSGIVCLSFAPEGDRLAYADAGSVRVMEVAGGRFRPPVTISADPFHSNTMLRWSPDGRLLAGGGDGWRIWEADDWSILGEQRDGPDVTELAWAPRGDAIAVAASVARKGRTRRDRKQGLVDILTPGGELLQHLVPGSGPVRTMAWSPAGDVLAASATTERAIGVYSVGVGIGAAELESEIHENAVRSASEELITLWNPRTATAEGVLRGHRRAVSSLDWLDDGLRLASGSEDGTVRIWRTELAEDLDERSLRSGHLDRIGCAAICPSGSTFATASSDTTVRFWDFGDAVPWISEKGDFAISALAWSPNSHFDLEVSATGRRVGLLARADEGFFRRSIRVRNLTSGKLTRLPASSFDVKCLAWAPTGARLAAGGERVVAWELPSTRRVLKRATDHDVTALGWSDDGRSLAWTDTGGRLKIFDRDAGEIAGDLHTHGPVGTTLEWLSATLLAVGHEDGSVALWDPGDDAPRWVSDPVSAAAWCLCSLPEERLIAAGFSDTSVRLFDAVSGRAESVVFVSSPVLALRGRPSAVDVVDDGSSGGSRPGVYRFGVEERQNE